MYKCSTPIAVAELRSVLSPAAVETYEKWKLREFADGRAEGRAEGGRGGEMCVTCPSCNAFFVSVDLAEEFADVWKEIRCGDDACGNRWCGGCGNERHREPGQPGDVTCKVSCGCGSEASRPAARVRRSS